MELSRAKTFARPKKTPALRANNTTSLFFFFLLATLSPRKLKYTCFTTCQYLVGVYKRSRLQNRSQFFFLHFSRQHCDADLEREIRAMHGEQVLQAMKKLKISNKASLFLFLFRWVYFLSKENVKSWQNPNVTVRRVTDFRSHAKGHAILCDVYYLLTNDWSDERFSKVTSLRWIFIPFCFLPEINSCNSCF